MNATFASAVELVRLQLELEYRLTPDGLLLPIEGSGERSRCNVYVVPGGAVSFVRFDVGSEARRKVAELDSAELMHDPDALVRLLGGGVVGRYETYVASTRFPDEACGQARRAGDRFVVEVDGEPASWAWSVRASVRAAECAVETAEPFRRRGLATQATAAWVNAVLASSKVPFYSHAAANGASRALAEKLGLVHAFTVLAVE